MLLAQNKNLFEILFMDGGAIGWLIWLINFAMLGISIHFFIQTRRVNILPDLVRAQIEEMFENKQYREVIDVTADQSDFLSYVMHAALTEAPHGYPAMERAMEEAAEERTTKMLRNIEWLNLIGNIGPMLGLLGTVWGMIGAFFSIVEKGGTPKPEDLAGDIGVALVTTMLGLMVAIPALSIYAFLRNRIDALTSEAMLASQELISTFRPSARKG
jgi:biopolymer transport protein ExbB